MHGGTVHAHGVGIGQGAEFLAHLPIMEDSSKPDVAEASCTSQADAT